MVTKQVDSQHTSGLRRPSSVFGSTVVPTVGCSQEMLRANCRDWRPIRSHLASRAPAHPACPPSGVRLFPKSKERRRAAAVDL
jgi:hypothetical protein